ncbi:carbon-nitrogen hydrolase [Fragilaria crotonensis]|nr:carbon-nitrogen hydrolase [Fragilaria crotonensis]
MSTSISAAAAASSSSSLPKPKAAVVQLTSTSNKFSNLVKIARCAAFAKQQGASMLFLPECFGFMGSSATETLENAEIVETTTIPTPDKNDNSDACRRNDPAVNDILISLVTKTDNLDVTSVTEASTTTAIIATIHNDGSTTDQEYDNASISLMDGLRTIAQASNLWISGGGIHEYIDGTSVYNTHIILNDKGHVISKYRKVHLFDVCIPDRGVDARESRTTTAGDKSLVVCDSPLGILGLTICYDMRFPEQYTSLVQQGGAQIMLMPSAFMVPTGQAHWHVLLRARAIETQCYVIAAAQVGRHNEKTSIVRTCCGD